MLNNIQDIRESGLLELYVLGELTPGDISQVEAALELYPELKTDLNEIEKAFHSYAEAHAIQAPYNVLNKVLAQTKSDITTDNSTSSSSPSSGIGTLAKVALLVAFSTILFQFFSNRNLSGKYAEDLKITQDNCDDEKQNLESKLALYRELDKINNRSISVSATEKYPETKIIFNTNEVSKRNFLQFKFLPPLESNQSYQLWSLKGNNPPIPLNVFEDISELLEVDFVEGTNAYAITIEPKGGQDTPTLENLIGVFSITG